MKDFELIIKYDGESKELKASKNNYEWNTYIKMKTAYDIIWAVLNELEEILKESD